MHGLPLLPPFFRFANFPLKIERTSMVANVLHDQLIDLSCLLQRIEPCIQVAKIRIISFHLLMSFLPF